MTIKEQTMKELRVEFCDKDWSEVIFTAEYSDGNKLEITRRQVIEDFVLKALDRQKEEILSKLPKNENYPTGTYMEYFDAGFNACLDKVKSIIKGV